MAGHAAHISVDVCLLAEALAAIAGRTEECLPADPLMWYFLVLPRVFQLELSPDDEKSRRKITTNLKVSRYGSRKRHL